MGLKVDFNLELDENVWTFIQKQSSEQGITVDEYVENIMKMFIDGKLDLKDYLNNECYRHT